ncbi:response regulator [Gracilibacillus salinarum]|uniref:response regulator n=1 Tax=Gracilibacillus salinarum TaxID=2932255 RepID=UPI0034E1DFFC
MLLEADGFTLCQRIRENYHYPVIMLTAMIEETDKITRLTLGADDYITKLFIPIEMVARVISYRQGNCETTSRNCFCFKF